jgi:hypothetical protein
MTDQMRPVALLHLKDFTAKSGDRYFLHDSEVMNEVDARQLGEVPNLLITHDYGLAAPSIRSQGGRLPKNVIDVGEFYKATCALTQGDGSVIGLSTEDLLKLAATFIDVNRYSDVFYRRTEFDHSVYARTGSALLKLWSDLERRAADNNELERYMQIEAPVFNLFWASLSKGIGIDRERLRQHKESARDEYYLTLRDFAMDFSLPIEVPSEKMVDRELEMRGFDISGGDRDYILEFLPMSDHFGSRLSNLLKLNRSLNALNQLPTSRKLVFPLVDISGTRTSRILLKAPSLQNLAKKHRDVITAQKGQQLCYVDFCQFEPGIIAALSKDPEILNLYGSGDLYKEVSLAVFGSKDLRKVAKQLFLSYSYGMSQKKIADAASEHGANRKVASEFFRRFSTFEKWKEEVIDLYQQTGKVGTTLGNYSRRANQGELTSKERRSCISQVVQGTGSLIFNKSVLALHKKLRIVPLIPMHDAVLFETSDMKLCERAIATMEATFDEHFGGIVKGRAELSAFTA